MGDPQINLERDEEFHCKSSTQVDDDKFGKGCHDYMLMITIM